MKLRNTFEWLKRVTPLRIALVIAVVFASAHFVIESEFFEFGPLSKKGLIHLLDRKALDLKFGSLSGKNLPEPRVVLAAGDEKSVQRYGLWPWSRSVMADFITAATKGGAKVIAFDAVFADEDRNSSYVAIKRFLDVYEQGGLRPDAPLGMQLAASVELLRKHQEATRQAFAQLDRKLTKAKAPRREIAAELEQARRAAAQADFAATRARDDLEKWRERSQEFYGMMSHEVASVSPDDALARAVEQSPQTILGYFNFHNESELVGLTKEQFTQRAKLLLPFGVSQLFEVTTQEIGDNEVEIVSPVPEVDFEKLQVRRAIALQSPLEKLSRAAKGFGYFNADPDPDGPLRQIRQLVIYENRLFPSLSLATAARYFDTDVRPLNGQIKPGVTLDGIMLGSEISVPTDLHGRLLVNYYTNPVKYFPSYSVADFIDGSLPVEKYKDKVVLFGLTAQGLDTDMRATPFDPTTPGVYVHAAAIQSMLDGRYLERVYGIAILEMVAYLLLGLLLGFVLPRIPIWGGVLLTLGITVGFYFFDIYFIFSQGVWTLNVLPGLEATAIFVGTSVYGYLTEGREKRKVRKAFQYYLTKSVVDEVLKDTSKLQLGGERRVCTVFFSDIRGFTTISEKLSPEDLVHLLNSYLTPMTNIVFKYDGTLDKYMGDAIMAIFGAPIGYQDHASRACYASLEMMKELKVLQDGWRARNLPAIDIGIGLNTGPMSVGNMGSDVRFDYTVMGDNVNLGSRLEGINKQYGTNIIISEFTYAAAKQDIHAREMDSVRVKGKKEPVRIYELLGRGNPDANTAEMIATFELGIATYKSQKWDEATKLFVRVRDELKPDDFAAKLYIDRCATMKEHPPAGDWDGVYTMTTK